MDQIVTLINSYFHEPYASLVAGIVIGRPLFVTDHFYQSLKDVGLIHIVVLSGMNITLLTAIIMNAIVPFVGRTIASIITIVLIIAFVFLVGAEAPIIRAAIMGILALVGLLFGRQTIALWLLFLSGTIMVIIDHTWLTSISFQLSFSATLGIILFGSVNKNADVDIIVDVDKDKKKSPFLWKYFLEELRISLAAQVFTLPIIFWYFRQVSLISPVANVLVAWSIAPIMILSIIMIGVGMISWHLGFYFALIIYPLIQLIVTVVNVLANLPFASLKI